MTAPLPLARLAPEYRLLLHAAGGADQDAAIRQLAAAPLDWNRLLDIADYERATAPLLARLTGLGCFAAPKGVQQRWRRLAMISDFEAAHLERRLHALLLALGPLAADVVLLKGAALGSTVYAQFRQRPMRDLDLLVPPALVPQVRAVALHHGWVEGALEGDAFYDVHQHLAPLVDAQGSGVQLELHTELLAGRHPYALTGDLMRRDSRVVPVGGVASRVPSTVDQVIHLALHLGWSHKMRSCAWRTFRDVHAVLGQADFAWAAMVERARATRTEALVYWMLGLGATYAGVPAPPKVLRALRPPLPWPMHGLIARHFALQLNELRPACPSEALGRSIWSRGVGVRMADLSLDDPWERDKLLRCGPPEQWKPRRATWRRAWTRSILMARYGWSVMA